MTDKAILQKFMPDLIKAELVDNFENFEAGGNFAIFKIWRSGSEEPAYVCLLDNEMISHPFSQYHYSPVEEIELGWRWRVKGCFYSGTGRILSVDSPEAANEQKMTDMAHELRVCAKHKAGHENCYYLYLLTPLK